MSIDAAAMDLPPLESRNDGAGKSDRRKNACKGLYGISGLCERPLVGTVLGFCLTILGIIAGGYFGGELISGKSPRSRLQKLMLFFLWAGGAVFLTYGLIVFVSAVNEYL